MKMHNEKLTSKGQEMHPEVSASDLLRGAMEAFATGHIAQDPLTQARNELVLPGYQRMLAQRGVSLRGSLNKEKIEIVLEIRKSTDPKKREDMMKVIVWRAANGSSGILLTRGATEQTTINEYALPTTLGAARKGIRKVIEEAFKY